MLFNLKDEYDSVNTENCMLKNVYSDLKKDVRKHANEILKCEKLQVDEKTLGLCEDPDKFNDCLLYTSDAADE